MKNETPMYLVPGRLSKSESTPMFVVEAYDFLIKHIGTPIQPCADVETVGYGRQASFADLKNPACHGVSIHKEWDGGIPLVRRTDMEAQVTISYEKGWVAGKRDACNQSARVAAEKDAEIAKLRRSIDAILMLGTGRLPATLDCAQALARAALNEGAAG